MARDYRSFSKYNITDIYVDELESKEWLGKRMAFLWECREYYPDRYLDNELNVELQVEFYSLHDSEVDNYASEAYSIYEDLKLSDCEVLEGFKKYEDMRKGSPREFLLAKNKKIYDYCKIEVGNRGLYGRMDQY